MSSSRFTGDLSSNQPLLALGGSGDASMPRVGSILGVPLHSVPDPAIPPGVVWSIAQDRVAAVLRHGVDLVISGEAFFTSDSVAIRARLPLRLTRPPTVCARRFHHELDTDTDSGWHELPNHTAHTGM
jgi:hypothetical protein